MKFGQIPTKFQENFDEMHSDLIKIAKKSWNFKFWKKMILASQKNVFAENLELFANFEKLGRAKSVEL